MLEMKFNIQMFADGGGEGGGDGQQEQQNPATAENNDNPDGGEKKSENKQSDVDIDAKIAEALSKAQKNFEDTLKKREAAAKKEAELSKLSDAERQKAEIENGRKELELKEKELQRKELMLEMTKVLAERNLPVEFTEYLIAENSESELKLLRKSTRRRLKRRLMSVSKAKHRRAEIKIRQPAAIILAAKMTS